MEVEIITTSFKLDIYGLEGIATNKDYAGTAFKLSAKMWELIKGSRLKNKGKNVWVYEPGEVIFTGVELEDQIDEVDHGLKKKQISLKKYAYHKHVGPYNLIRQTGQNMTDILVKQGLEVMLPYIEIYGHWTGDETKSETELIMCLK